MGGLLNVSNTMGDYQNWYQPTTTGQCMPGYQTVVYQYPWVLGESVDKTKKAIEKIQALMDAGFLAESLTVKDFLKVLSILSD